MTTRPLDMFGRPLGALRVSVTDRCNLRCQYCMPEEHYQWLPRESLLSFDEITRLVRVFASLGTGKIRLTGGEPLLRPELPELVRMLSAVSGVREIALTTNGVLLASKARALKDAGLNRITVSLDTLDPERWKRFARYAKHDDVLDGLDAAHNAGFVDTKLNTVAMRGLNDDEYAAITAFAWERGIEPRFIEYMDVGGATRWSPEQVVSREEIIAAIEERFGDAVPVSRDDDPHAPAERWRFANGLVAGVIASTTAPFCASCDRARVTADGTFYRCLYATSGFDLREPLRAGASDEELEARITGLWRDRMDRGAEQRVGLAVRGVLVPLEALKADPRREMHVRGG